MPVPATLAPADRSPLPGLSPTVGVDASLRDFVDSLFVRLAMAEGRTLMRTRHWTTSTRKLPTDAELLSASDTGPGGIEALYRLPQALVYVFVRGGGSVMATVAAADRAGLKAGMRWIGARLPRQIVEPARQEVSFGVWVSAPQGPFRRASTAEVPSWEEVSGNYAASTREALERLVADPRPGFGGRLLLWHGEPGTGKTFALRALAYEWRDWCDVDIVTDPERLLGAEPAYLMHLLTIPPQRDRWRLIVLEDAGELVGLDAPRTAGQALSRLLNTLDGILGQGSRTLVLITTNEPLSALHPAISRPGRCAQRVEFLPLDEEEAAAWLARHDASEVPAPTGEATVAELYGAALGFPAAQQERAERFGFARVATGSAA